MALLDPPVPISAQDIVNQALVTFNHPLIPGPVDTANWSVRSGNLRFTISIATIPAFTPTIVDLMYNLPGAADPGPDVVDYTPPPSDVISNTTRQLPAPGFLDFPLT